jgi:hypothetical protein
MIRKLNLVLFFLVIPIVCYSDAGIIGIVGIGISDGVVYENFTGYTEVDPSDDITIDSSTQVSWAALDTRSSDSYIYIDKTVDHFNGDLVHQFEVTTTSGSASYYQMTVWMISTDVNNSDDITDGLYLQINGSAVYRWQLSVVENLSESDTNYSGSNEAVEGTKYYITMTLDWDGGANSTGQIQAEIRTISHVNETGKVTITSDRSVGEQNTYRYLYGLSSYNTGDSGHTHTGSVENLNINE